MVNPVTIIDLTLLTLFLLFSSAFLYRKRENLKREGLLFLYRTKWGIKLINYVGNRYKKTLSFLSYVSITIGYLLVAGVLYMVYSIVKIYFFSPEIVRAIKVPPILPLFPYLPQAFQLSFLPPFYFTYWIVILAIIAITHEFAHGIFAVHDKVKVKSTGFGFFPFFLPVFLAAFVELDEKIMAKKKKFSQLAVLSAGTFANVLTAILFFIVMVVFFSLAFSASGVVFDSYATSTIAIAGISSVNGIHVSSASYSSILDLTSSEGLSELGYGNATYITTKTMIESQTANDGKLIVYDSAPAINANLSSIITEINGVNVDGVDKLASELGKYSPGDSVTITTKTSSGFETTNVVLEEHPQKQGTAWLGIGFVNKKSTGIISGLISKASSFKKQDVYYAPKINASAGLFIYNMLWWIVLISVSVALMNMLPVGIFDGGRFFYLTVLAITKSESKARKAFKFSTYFFLVILLLLMVFWGLSFFR